MGSFLLFYDKLRVITTPTVVPSGGWEDGRIQWSISDFYYGEYEGESLDTLEGHGDK